MAGFGISRIDQALRQVLFALLGFVSASAWATAEHRYFRTSDGVRLHYLEAGSGSRTLVFIPGWLMPAAVFESQLEILAKDFRVLAFDPRSQGLSQIAGGSHSPEIRLRDIDQFLAAAKVEHFILAGWSLGVLESLDYVSRRRPPGLVGMILIDNSIGEGAPPPPRSTHSAKFPGNAQQRHNYLIEFSRSVFGKPPAPALQAAVTASALRVPPAAAQQLLHQPYPRTYWRDGVAALTVPVLYAITPRLREQGEALGQRKPPALATVIIFENAGHALFVDAADQFNEAVSLFADRAFADRSP